MSVNSFTVSFQSSFSDFVNSWIKKRNEDIMNPTKAVSLQDTGLNRVIDMHCRDIQ